MPDGTHAAADDRTEESEDHDPTTIAAAMTRRVLVFPALAFLPAGVICTRGAGRAIRSVPHWLRVNIRRRALLNAGSFNSKQDMTVSEFQDSLYESAPSRSETA